MFLASWNDHSETVELLLRNGAKDIPNKVISKHSIYVPATTISSHTLSCNIQFRDTALGMAKEDNHREVIRLLQRYQN